MQPQPKNKKNMNLLHELITHMAIGALAFSLSGCNNKGLQTDSEYYTRGIGEYPGNKKENFSPELTPDFTNYRNIALHRAGFASSNHDYNLTAQLVTDGMVMDGAPQYLSMYTPQGEVPRREREWMIDMGPYSTNTFMGSDTYFQYSMNNYAITARSIRIKGKVIYEPEKAKNGYDIIVMTSKDGKSWKEAGRNHSKKLPGEQLKNKIKVTDPNKQSEQVDLPVRLLDERVRFGQTVTASHFKILLKMEGTHSWVLGTTDFLDQKSNIIDIKPSQYFNSSWMSQTNGQEWYYVDLGSQSKFDKIVLHWGNKAIKGKVQISDDAQTWADLTELSGKDESKEVIELDNKAEARYVRILMEQAAGDARYILKEMEVWGTGGMAITAHNMKPADSCRMDLSGGNWKLQRASEVTAEGKDISTTGFNTYGWIAATVPGTVLSSYVNIGAIANPNYADNQLHISESFFNSDFWYRNEFCIPSTFDNERIFLNFDGINWKANIWLNGKQLGRIEGAFMRGQYDITDQLQEGINVLAVQIIKNANSGAIKEKDKFTTDLNGGILGADNPTFHATIGWDWIPTMRGRNIGIWNDVYLTSAGKVTLDAPIIQSELPLPATDKARLTAEVIVKNHSNQTVRGTLNGKMGDISFAKEVVLEANEEKAVVFTPEDYPQLNMSHPKLWWPRGYGEPYLYDSAFRFEIDSKVSDTKTFKTGIRQMTFAEDNHVLTMFVNGRRFIARGGNWGYSESNLNYRAREYDIAVKYHADMNFTMLRNWVGMIGDEELYEACDRHGVMVWQDFWLANPWDGPDPNNEKMFMENAEDYVKRIRSHASIGLYCGRNEGYPPATLDKALRQLVKEQHSGLHYISSSADDVVSGHGPYRMLPAKTYFTLETGNDKLHSERGMPNVMTYESMQRTFSDKGIWPQGHQWGMHDYTQKGAQGCTSFNEIIAKGYGQPQSAQQFSELAQWVNYDGHRSMFESRSNNRKGLLMWMSHSCWPSMVWQTYDYYFEPTAAYFAIKRASEPLHIQWNPATDEIEVVNYSAGTRERLTAKVQILNMDATLVWEKEASVNSTEDSTQKCIRLEYPTNLSKVHFIKLQLIENGKVISDNFYHRSMEENNYQELNRLAKASLNKTINVQPTTDGNWQAHVVLKNTSKVPALMIRLNLVGEDDGIQILPVLYQDNYFSLLPGEEKTVCITWKDEDTRGNKGNIMVSGFNL